MRKQRLVLFGRYTSNAGLPAVGTAHTFEWEPSVGWVEYPASGPVGGFPMWFDHQRGRLLRYSLNGNVQTVSIREPNNTWVPVPTTFTMGQIQPSYALHDTRRGRTYAAWVTGNGYLTFTNPARYDHHGSGCTSPSAPVLSLTKSWTRPWLGDVMSVDLEFVPHSFAVLATGFSDQAYGTSTLPWNLAAAGMPGCTLRVAPEHLLLGVDPDGVVTFEMPVPALPALVGLSFWQQAFTYDPTANTAGMQASNSMRGVIGRSH